MQGGRAGPTSDARMSAGLKPCPTSDPQHVGQPFRAAVGSDGDVYIYKGVARYVDTPDVRHVRWRSVRMRIPLTRVALTEGAMVVNSSQNGGAKDTWVLPR